ncbi:PEGA domain-containing protein [Chondromyces apiculatus]|nr:PEGA domain-containing protein [Chondromyces apiculatus]
MRLLRALLLSAACAALVSISPRPAGAQVNSQRRAEAQKVAAPGQVALQQKRFAEAIEPLQRAVAIDPGPLLRLDLARAFTGAKRFVEANAILQEIANGPAETPLAKGTQTTARKLLADLGPRIPGIQVLVSGPAPSAARILIDGKETDARSEVPLDPGEHTVRVEAEGFTSAERRPTLAEGEHLRVELTLEPDAAVMKKKEEAAKAARALQPLPSSSSKPPLPALIALGAGAAGVAVGSVFGILAFTGTASTKDHCAGNICPNERDVVDSRDAALRNGTISTVGFVVGGVGIATGLVLLVTSTSSSRPTTSPARDAATLRPWIGAGQAGVVGTF